MTENRGALAFLCHPYHRGGVTRWMLDAAVAWKQAGGAAWFVTAKPRTAFANGGGRPAMVDLLEALPEPRRPNVAMRTVGSEFELGTDGYRARVYARTLQTGVPSGVPVVVSDDVATWQAVELLGGRNPLIGVLHADEGAYYALADQFHRSASALVAVSHRIARNAQARLGPAAPSIAVIPCGVPLAPIAASDRPGGTLRIVWIGRISEYQKRVSDLARIAVALRARHVPFTMSIIGDGEDAPLLRSLITEAGLADAVRLHGWLPAEQVQSLLRESDIMLLPSNFEGMPVAAMEALGAGCAVVASDTSGLEEYVDVPAATNALRIFPRGDVHRGADAVIAAAKVAPETRRAAARQLAEQEFSIETCMDRYAGLHHRLHEAPVASGATVPAWSVADVASLSIAAARRARRWVSTQTTATTHPR